MKIYVIVFSLFIISSGHVFSQKPPSKLKVLQFNIWQEGTVVPGGFDAIINEVIRTEADLIALSEVRNYKNRTLSKRLVSALKKKGYQFYSKHSEDSGILSRYPIVSQEAIYPLQKDQGSITKAIIDVGAVQVAFYSGHLDYRNCSSYLPRGYHSSTWAKLDAIVTDSLTIAQDNLDSKRDEAIQSFIQDALKESKQGRIVIFGGDFNEPSYLDWTEATKNSFDHQGVVMEWHNTLALNKAGFIDAYRQIYPNPMTHPGFTFPADNPLVPLDRLAWAPDADERERIDYIFYFPTRNLSLNAIKIIGPKGSIRNNQRMQEVTEDPIEEPQGVWPTDHKALLATFMLKQ
ncbi:endonuclease/exonuclease/phosphatase family protein [Arenibacter sp. 6A1]|uniref:endonuclease/exonuclease/phosphatase family protein n=1 Tax=Arenibacter sp. 6A1 TaxID=2720391 RepID=UPI0014486340|nr:endonuclease/exonuclease/phosphatase family protein [Arenibacter sp. 6A1]NKI26926.1 endonuclease/exonuclease/phosphatase family protein [Arenibacter sp. 6A1]